jgi:hypothetical protein
VTDEGKARGVLAVIVRLGAAATALTAIIALGVQLWPDEEGPAPRRSGTIRGLTLEPNVTAADYARGHSLPTNRCPGLKMPAPTRLAGLGERGELRARLSRQARVAEATDVEAARGPSSYATSRTEVGLELIDYESRDDEVETGPEGATGGATGSQGATGATGSAGTTGTDSRTVGRASLPIVVGHPEPKPGEVLKVVEGSRLARGVSVPLQGGLTEALAERLAASVLGDVVNFDVRLVGFTGKCTYVRWTLFNAETQTRVRDQRWVDQDALYFIAEAQDDAASSAVWVPLPRHSGPFFVRLELFDHKATRLDLATSDPSR